MVDFKALRNMTPEQKKRHKYRTSLRLAEVCLEHLKSSSNGNDSDVYDALSHLAEVPELEINISGFDRLQYGFDANFDKDAYLFAREKVKQLESLIKSMPIA